MNKLWKGLSLAAIVLGSASAFAGEVLHFKTVGDIATPDVATFSANSLADSGLYVVQWKRPIRESEKAELSSRGLKLISYIPDDAFLVSADLSSMKAISQLDFVHSVTNYSAAMKVEAELARENHPMAVGQTEDISVIVTDVADMTAIRAMFSSVSDVSATHFVGEATSANVWALANRKDVIWVERYLAMSTMDMTSEQLLGKKKPTKPTTPTPAPSPMPSPTPVPSPTPIPTPPPINGYESGTKVMNVQAAYDNGFHGEGQLVSYGDTGLDSGDLTTLIPDFQGQVQAAFAIGLGGHSWADQACHGTHVAGSMVGDGASSNGNIRGGAYGAKIVVEGLWSDILNNLAIPSIQKLFDTAYNAGARIHSNSWGAPNSDGRYDAYAHDVDQYVFDHPDFLPVFAAGNDGVDHNNDGVIDEGSVSSPGSAKNALTVGASKNLFLTGGIQEPLKSLRNGTTNWGVEPLASSLLSEDPHGLACFSSRGPTADGRLKPDVVSPGTNIISARTSDPKADPTDSWGIYNDHYLYMGGTSMATPLTSGAMTLIRQYLVKQQGAAPVSAALMKATIANTAEDLFPGQFGLRAQGQEEPTRRPNNHEGWGLVNLDNVFNNHGLMLVDDWKGVATGGDNVVKVTVKDPSRALKITMAYSDAPGTVAAAKTLVNDLELVVTDPSGQAIALNGENVKTGVNNMEEVDVLAPVAGVYTVHVQGANVPQGKNGAQPYALVVSGGL